MEEMFVNQIFYSSKNQQIMEFKIYFSEDIQEVNSCFVYDRGKEKIKQ